MDLIDRIKSAICLIYNEDGLVYVYDEPTTQQTVFDTEDLAVASGILDEIAKGIYDHFDTETDEDFRVDMNYDNGKFLIRLSNG